MTGLSIIFSSWEKVMVLGSFISHVLRRVIIEVVILKDCNISGVFNLYYTANASDK